MKLKKKKKNKREKIESSNHEILFKHISWHRRLLLLDFSKEFLSFLQLKNNNSYYLFFFIDEKGY